MNINYFALAVPIKTIKVLGFLMLTCLATSFSNYGQTTKTLTTSGELEVPAGVTSLSVQCWGAGGGGGGSNNTLSAAGGGGGGAFKGGTVTVGTHKDNIIVPYTVGSGGLGGTSTSINGSAGGSTIFSTIFANGGGGGQGGTALIQYGSGGVGGIATGVAGDYRGGNGANAYLLGASLIPLVIEANISGGGGSSAGTASNGNNASGKNGGAAVTNGGGGGAGNSQNVIDLLLSPNNPGTSGSFPSGGGGGAVGVGVVNGVVGGLIDGYIVASNGGNGGNGQIKVDYTCPTYSISNLSADAACVQTSAIQLTGNLPIGTYTVTYNRSAPSAIGLTATMVVEVAGTGIIDVVGLPTAGSSTITITELKSVDCISVVNAAITFDRAEIPTVAITTHPSCAVPKGTVVLNNLIIGGTIYQTGISSASYPIIENPQTITGLDSGNYNFVVSNGICSSLTVSDITSVGINNPPPAITWNGCWDGVPTPENKVIFAESYNDDSENLDENTDIEACSCEVNSGAHVTFKTGRYLKLRNELKVDANGSLTFENNASLVQMNDDSENEGKIIYERHTKPVKRYDFTYWSSPVEGQTLKNLSPNTLYDKYYSFNPGSGWQIHYNGNKEMMPGEGYIIRAPQSFSITDPAVDDKPKFDGKPNNGEIKKELSGGLVYLLGNPYPSAMSADAFLTENATQLEGTLYFWTHNSPPSIKVDGNAIYNYTANDYATYNLTGGVATHAAIQDDDENDPNDNNNLSVPSGNIAAAQGFFAQASTAGGEIVFNNAMRLLDGELMDDGQEYDEVRDNSQFFKLGRTSKSTNSVDKNRLWLNLSNAQGAFKQTLIGYITGATNGYEGRFDGMSYDGNQYLDFYSINQGTNLSIQGRALPFQKQDSIVLGYKTTIVGDFKISIDHADGILASQKVFLEDKLLQILHDLKEPYSFTTEKGIFKDRFVLRYLDKNAAIEDTTAVEVEGVLISTNDKVIKINSATEIIDAIYIYDFSGELVYSDMAVDAVGTTISNLSVAHPALIIQVVLANGKKASKKIIY
ncbi:glycine-rich domain-containing protein [Flavobacterium sp. GSA192]|uniref:glycine-rich domain-containing protein n=1 Tax=Flavobacterium sp. GSA192 TaxID=2576304 RepID=UPI00112CEBDD|nr:hypothetical protein [Flavobacterium sp. GSA192]